MVFHSPSFQKDMVVCKFLWMFVLQSFYFIQWEFQDPKMEVPTIYKAYIRPMQVNITTKYGDLRFFSEE